MNWWQMWLLVKLDDLHAVFIGFLIASAVTTLVSIILSVVGKVNEGQYGDEVCAKLKPLGFRLLRYSAPFLVLFVLCVGVIPTTKQAAVIVIVPRICAVVESNEQLKQMPDKIMDLASTWLEELKPGKPTTRPAKE